MPREYTSRVTRPCDYCGTDYTKPPSMIGYYCSKACRYADRIPLAERFWVKVNKTEGCWLWTGKTGNGYGQIRTAGKGSSQIGAHRLSWLIHFGPIPDGLLVCHDCPDGDNPLCVRPDHLFLGTHVENMADMAQKGRAASGYRNGRWRVGARRRASGQQIAS